MIKESIGDVLEADFDFLLHGVNCLGVMGAGVAAAIKEKWPEVYEEYKYGCDAERDPYKILGGAQYVKLRDGSDRTVVNCFTQLKVNRYSRAVSYDAVDHCFLNVARHVGHDAKIVLPKIGAGLGGGNWEVIELLLEQHLGNHNVRVYSL